MKKSLLFVIPSLSAGGGEKSLINLLSQINFNLYDVDLFLFSPTGTFLNTLPEQVNLVQLPSNYKVFTRSLPHSLKGFIKQGKLNLAYSRLLFTLTNRSMKSTDLSEQYTWKYQRKAMDTMEKVYDVAIGYLEKSSIYFVVDKVQSKKKIGWIHTNYGNSEMDPEFDKPYFEQLNELITVSEECSNSLYHFFPHLRPRIHIIHNIVSPATINQLAEGEHDADWDGEGNVTTILTVARLSHEKGIDLAVKACARLRDKGHSVKWYVLGEGNERAKLEQLIASHALQAEFKLLGVKANPYPYIRKADIYVQPSRYEGKSIAIDEAKILNKPIVVTNFETARDQITDGHSGLIVNMSAEGLALGIERLLHNRRLRERLIQHLSEEQLGSEEEIHKLYALMGGGGL